MLRQQRHLPASPAPASSSVPRAAAGTTTSELASYQLQEQPGPLKSGSVCRSNSNSMDCHGVKEPSASSKWISAASLGERAKSTQPNFSVLKVVVPRVLRNSP